jgi:hypothetical protein
MSIFPLDPTTTAVVNIDMQYGAACARRACLDYTGRERA